MLVVVCPKVISPWYAPCPILSWHKLKRSLYTIMATNAAVTINSATRYYAPVQLQRPTASCSTGLEKNQTPSNPIILQSCTTFYPLSASSDKKHARRVFPAGKELLCRTGGATFLYEKKDARNGPGGPNRIARVSESQRSTTGTQGARRGRTSPV